ncbi:hypothetical protein TNCV_2915381 [Trichonephila clavipes]|nr:hypothetical protein TNCV_2915381 [Trichonephila clavipes]
MAVVAKWSRQRIRGRRVTSSSLVTLKTRRSPSEVGGGRWEALDHTKGVLPRNYGGKEPNRTINCRVLTTTTNAQSAINCRVLTATTNAQSSINCRVLTATTNAQSAINCRVLTSTTNAQSSPLP